MISAERLLKGLGVVFHHFDITGGGAIGLGERARVERAANAGTGFIGDTLEQAGVGDILEKHRRDIALTHGLDERGHVPGRRLGLGTHPLRREEVHPVFVSEILEGVMGGDNGALIRWQ